MWLCFAFFFFTTAGLSAVQSFASPALHSLYPQLSLAVHVLAGDGFYAVQRPGHGGGGFLAARVQRLDRVIARLFAAGRGAVGFGGNGLAARPCLALAVGAAAGFGQGWPGLRAIC